MHHLMRGVMLTTKKLCSSTSAERQKKEHDYYLKNGSLLLEEILALCDGNCRIPIRYFGASEIKDAVKHSKSRMELSDVYYYLKNGSLDNRLVLVRFNEYHFSNIHRDIAITAQMSHLKNVLRLIGCCLEFGFPVMVYEYVEGISLSDLLFEKGRKSLTWGNRLQIGCEVVSVLVFLHTEFNTPIIHKDIKSSKVIIDQNSGVAKIVDFSLSISLPPGELEVEDRVCGTIGYLPPEYILKGIITQKTDVYSFGVLLFQILTGKKLCDIMEADIEVGDVLDSIIFEDTIDFEEDGDSNIEEGNSMDRVDSAIDFENLPLNLIEHYIKEGNAKDIADPAILEEHGIEIRQQLEDFLDLVKKCTTYKAENRPYMIHVAEELRRIQNNKKN